MNEYLITDMVRHTDAEGTLILHDAPGFAEADAGWRFCKCTVRWEDVQGLTVTADELCLALEDLTRYYRETGAPFGSCPAVFPEAAPDPDTAESQARMTVHWMLYFDGIDLDDKKHLAAAAEKSLGRPMLAAETLRRIHHYCKILTLGAPEIIVRAAHYCMIRTLALNAVCEEFGTAVLTAEPDQDGRIGCFSPRDLAAVTDLLGEDRSLLLEQKTGYALLASRLSGGFRPRFLHRPAKTKTVLDGMLETLLPTERDVLRMHYGLGDGSRRSADEIALALHYPVMAVQGALSGVIRKLAPPPRHAALERI